MTEQRDTALAVRPDTAVSTLEEVVIKGDLSSLTPAERLRYYAQVCQSLKLNPFTKPFQYIHFDKKGLQLYATRDATDQLRKINGISVTDLAGHADDDIYVCTAKGIDKDGRTDMATGAVPYGNLRGEARANAIMKAETKSKRRLTLSLAGLGWLDEVEVESIEETDTVNVDHETGEILPSTWEGKVRIGSRAGANLVLGYLGDPDTDPDNEYLALAMGKFDEPAGMEFTGFKIEFANRKTAQVICFGDLAQSLFTLVDDGGSEYSSPEERPAFAAGDLVRVTGQLEFVEWEKDGRKMQPYRRIVAGTVEKA